MAKRNRQGLDSPPLSDMSAPKYRRVAPKQEMELGFHNGPTTNQVNDTFGMRPNINPQQPYNVSNYRPT